MNIYEKQQIETRVIIGRECDNCHLQERSDRNSIVFDHSTDIRWAKVQLHTTYTVPSNNSEYHLCSQQCLKEFARRFAEIYIPISADSNLSGIPLGWFRDVLGDK